MKRRSERSDHCYFKSDQNITSEEEESPRLSINSSFFEEPKSLEVVVGLNLSSRPRLKDITTEFTTSHKTAGKLLFLNIFKRPACQDFLKEATRSTISREFKDYCHSTTFALKYNAPSELVSWSLKFTKTSLLFSFVTKTIFVT